MRKTYRKWMSIVLILTMMMSLLPAMSAVAATARISITQPSYVTDTQPDVNAAGVPRITSLPYTVRATIENISDSQIAEIYYEVTNMTTTKTPIVEKANKAQKTSQFDIVFNNVQLTEGLNRIVVKLGTSSVITSAPAWVYFTPTTALSTINVNGVPFEDGKIYPDNPTQSTMINISGSAPNASEVRAYLEGDAQPKNAFINNGDFFFLADDINKPQSTASMKLRPGDNPMTIMAVNSTKTYQTSKNLIYDNGKPFAFNAKIKETANGLEKELIKSPTVSSNNVTISALLKNDLTTAGTLQYNFVEVLVGGQKFGPYNLSGAQVAPKATGISPTIIANSHSATHIIVTGEELSMSNKLHLTDKAGVAVGTGISPVHVNATKTAAVYPLAADTLKQANSPYYAIVKDGTTELSAQPFTITVSNATALPVITGATNITSDVTIAPPKLGKAGDDLTQTARSITLNSPVNANELTLAVTDLKGQPVGTAAANLVGGNYDFTIPAIQTEGLYKFKVIFNGSVLTERTFIIDKKDPTDPSISMTGQTGIAQSSSPTTLYFTGTDLGTIPGDYTAARLINQDPAKSTNVITAAISEVRDNAILVNIPNQSALIPGDSYKLEITKQLRYPDGTTAGAPSKTYTFGTSVGNSVYAQLAVPTATISSVTIPQVRPTELSTMTITAAGTGLSTGLSATVTNEDGTMARNAKLVSVAPTSDSATFDFSTIPTLPAGNYFFRIAHSGVLIGQYPFSVVDPYPGGFVEMKDGSNEILVSGTNFGANSPSLRTAYQLRYTPTDNPDQYTNIAADRIEAGRKIYFKKPGTLSGGSYTIELLYNGQPVGNPFSYTNSGAASKLSENSSWSRPGRYKVYDFSADLTIPSDRNQVVQFRFYNMSDDDVPATSFNFSYVDPNLPYVEYVESNNVRLSDASTNTLSELPAVIKIYANKLTQGMNVYVGEYLASSTPSDTLTGDTSGAVYNVFTLTLPETTPNGSRKITLVPKTTATNDKNGENLSGRKSYDFIVTNTPYIILNNVYNGMVVKNPGTDITCSRGGGCVSGRIVNIPIPDGTSNKVEIYVNEAINTTAIFDGNTFTFMLGALNEGRNKIKFNIIINSVLVATSEYEIFQFSTDAPEFLSIKPIETGDVKKFVPGTTPELFATSESFVSFSGQFANGSDIRITTRTIDENNLSVVKFDRRFGAGFGTAEPAANNPNYFRSINGAVGQFESNLIPLAPKGQTVFEFSVTNASGVTVTRTITIVREPLPYVIKSPVLTKNTNGEDQATINSNYLEIELEAEGATSVVFGKEAAVEREVNDNGIKKKRYYYEVKDLKSGKNSIKFTVNRGKDKINGSFVLYNVNTTVDGAQFKTALKPTMTAFNGEVTLKFPRGTNFMRNDENAVNKYLTSDRKILFGIANSFDGRVDKYKHPAPYDNQYSNPNPMISGLGKLMLTEPTARFRPAGNLIWIDAGTIKETETDMVKALSGSGRLPYDQEEFYVRNGKDQVIPTQRGTLTLKYDPAIRDDAWKYLTVYHFDIYEDYTGIVQWRWKNIGGVVDAAKNTITVPVDTFGYYQVMYMEHSFDDVTGHPWARNELDTLYARGVMSNQESSNFVPNAPITRGEFATMLVKIFDIPLQYSDVPTFTDVTRVNLLTRLYDYKYIETAAKAGIVRGAAQGRFMPDNAISRQDAAVMIARAANLKLPSEADQNKLIASLRKAFTDADNIDVYARTAVEAVEKAGFIEGKENVLLQGQKKATVRFDPLETFTRAEASVVAMRVMRSQGKVPK
ncbi:S-layer homology domain-containing protein [Paenibacillus sp. GCM10012303]|uniref:S-layer homology domain-containing protein n=1 Tax=Paenibacillus sp. GCM10012303 TaxID=3317340 RepID=UPI003613EE19